MAPKVSPEIKYKILTFLELKWSYSVIIKYFKERNISISKFLISKIKKSSENSGNVVKKVDKRGEKVFKDHSRIWSQTRTQSPKEQWPNDSGPAPRSLIIK